MKRSYNEMKTDFNNDLEELNSKKTRLWEIQKKYFNSSTRYQTEKLLYKQKHEKSFPKSKIQSLFKRKEVDLNHYKKSFKVFKQRYETKNVMFEKRTKKFLVMDTQIKMDYTRIWEDFVKGLFAWTGETRGGDRFPDLKVVFADVLPARLNLDAGINTNYSNLIMVWVMLSEISACSENFEDVWIWKSLLDFGLEQRSY